MQPDSCSFCRWVIELAHLDRLQRYERIQISFKSGHWGIGKLPCGCVCDSALQSAIIKSSTESDCATVWIWDSHTAGTKWDSDWRCWELNIMTFSREPAVIRNGTIVVLRRPSSRYCHLSSFATAGAAESHSYGAVNDSWWVCKECSVSSFSKLLHNREGKIDQWGLERVFVLPGYEEELKGEGEFSLWAERSHPASLVSALHDPDTPQLSPSG